MHKDSIVLQRRLGYRFGDCELLQQALTHSSFDGDKHINNQRLEYLGDAVLQLVITDVLYRQCPDMNEGQMTRVRSLIVREEALCHAAQQIGLGSFIVLGKGEEHTGGREKSSILADTMEAVFGALYLDGGMRVARSTITTVLKEAIEISTASTDENTDYKTRLQHLCAVSLGDDVTYHLMSSKGAPHERVFRIRAMAGKRELAIGEGTSKKNAEMDAAKNSIELLEGESRRGANDAKES